MTFRSNFSFILFGVLELLLYFCSRNSIETEPWIVVPGSSFSLLFLFYVLSDFFGMVRNRVQGIFSPVPFPYDYTLFFSFYLCGEDVVL